MDANGIAVAAVRPNREPGGFAAAYREPWSAPETTARLVATLETDDAPSSGRIGAEVQGGYFESGRNESA
jgi:hypothetical protein